MGRMAEELMFIPDKGKSFSILHSIHNGLVPPTLLASGYWGLKAKVAEASGTEVESLSFTSTP
jgi:hypothetical protein